MTDDAEHRMEEALDRSALADMRPEYRRLLLRLKQTDPDAFREASRRYQEVVEPSVAGGTADPIATWLAYGRWVASRFGSGRVLRIDRTGRARPLDENAVPEDGSLVIHLPDDSRVPVVVLARPQVPSEAQRTTTELLVS